MTSAAARVAEIVADAKHAGGSESLPERLCAACATALPVTGVGLAFMNDSGPVGTIAATGGAARRMEDLQLVMGEGPCVEASQSRRPVLQPDLAATAPARWPHFGPAVLRAGVASIFAFPVQVGAIRLGVLDLYRDSPGMLDAAQLNEALAFADAATEIILHLQAEVSGGSLHPQLSEAFAYNPVIHQATGMISVQAQVGMREALLLLRARAYASDRKLTEIAHDVTDRTLRWDADGEQEDRR
jgi:GAF domain-containing protein/ANTAR domain-containing protein